MADIEIYTGPGCAHCEAAKAMLSERGFDFTEHDVADPAQMDALRARLPRVQSIPQIFVDGAHIGNDQDLRHWLAK